MKILMLTPDPAVKGSMARLGAQLADAMSRLEVDVVICRWGRHADEESLLTSICGRVADIVHIRRLLGDGEFDVLFVNSAHDRRALMRDVPLLVATRGLARRRVVQFHGSLSNELSMSGRFLMKAASRWLVRNADAVLVLSSEEVREWQAFEPAGSFRLVANTYAHNAALEPCREDELGKTQDAAPVVLFVGRLLASKGIYDLVEAVARVRQHVDCRLAFAGGGGDEEALWRLVRARGLERYVRLLGYLQGPELARAYRTADVFALPSYTEGFPTVLAEAMDAGLPIVTTGIRGAVDHLADGRNALFVPPGRVDLLADALDRVLVDEDLRREMAAANRDKVRDFAPNVVAADYLRLFDTVLKDPDERPVS
jgi:glycosyltransferase involved in cell wall biosynthesis